MSGPTPDGMAYTRLNEGKRDRLYFDTRGIPTIGYGHNLLEPISDNAMDTIFYDDYAEAAKDAEKAVGTAWPVMGSARQIALIDMRFQLGSGGFRKFERMLQALNRLDYHWAANEMLNSRWHEQTPERCEKNAEIMRSGVFP